MISPGLEPTVLTPEEDQRKQDSICMIKAQGSSIVSHAEHLKLFHNNDDSRQSSLGAVIPTYLPLDPANPLAPALGEKTCQ